MNQTGTNCFSIEFARTLILKDHPYTQHYFKLRIAGQDPEDQIIENADELRSFTRISFREALRATMIAQKLRDYLPGRQEDFEQTLYLTDLGSEGYPDVPPSPRAIKEADEVLAHID